MGRKKPRAVLNLSQNHKQFKQRVHILNSALSNHSNIKTSNHTEVDQDSFISLQTKNSSTFTPNLMECILFPIFTSSHSTKAIDLIAKHSKKTNKTKKNASKASSLLSSNSNSNFPENLDINPTIYMNKGPKPLNQSLDYFTNWQTHLLVKNTQSTLNDYVNNLSLDLDVDGDYDCEDMAPFIHSHWPATYGNNKDYTKYINPNINTQDKESPYDILMLRCAQKCFADLIYTQLTFDDFVRFIENHFNYHFWTYYRNENEKNTKKRNLKLHFNRKIAALCHDINQEIKTNYFKKFVEKEIEFRLLVVMGNKKLLNTERSSHISSLSLFSIHKSIKKILDIVNIIDLKQVHLLSDNIILKWTQNIRDCMGKIDCLIKDVKELKYCIIQYLYEFGNKFKKYLKSILMKINEKNKQENASMATLDTNSYFDVSLIYIYKTNEQLIHRDIDYENMYKNEHNIPNENEYEAHIDLELCDFSEYLNYYRYILTVLDEYEHALINNYGAKLNLYLKYVAGEIEGSIWWRQIWEDRERPNRIKCDQQLSKKLLFLGDNKSLTLSLIQNKTDNEVHDINEEGLNKIFAIQQKVILYIQEILNNKDIEVSGLAIHIKLNLLNNNDYFKSSLLSELYRIIHDRDRPRGQKPEKSLKKIKEKAKLLLLKKEELKQKQKKKKIRIQTSEKHLQKLANVAPSASDIQRKYHESILKQRAQKTQRVKQRTMRINELKNKKRKRMSGPPVPALESLDDYNHESYQEPALKKRRKSSRIQSYGGHKRSYLEAEIEQYITYQFEFAIVSNWTAFLKSDIITKDNDATFKSFFATLFVGLHIDFEDEYHEWYEGIIEKVRISAKEKDVAIADDMDAKTQSVQETEDEILHKYDIKFLIHFKNFSGFWDSWLSISSPAQLQRIAVLRTYSNAYDVDDNVKPLAEVIRELDEQAIVSIDTISASLQLDRSKFVNWINSQAVEWDDADTIDKILKWTKKFLMSNKQNSNNNMMIALDYFVKAGNYSNKCDHMICEAVLSNSLNVELHSLTMQQMDLIQNKVIDNLKNKKYDYFTMANQCGIPLGLFQQIVFGITDLLPQFIIQQVIDWAKGAYLENLDLAIKEEQLFYVKIE